MPIEVWHVPRDTELLISDNAAFTFAYSDSNSKIKMNMAFGDSHGAALPIARDCLVAIGAAAKDDVLTADNVDLFNELQVRNADAYVYFRQSDLETFVRRIINHQSALETTPLRIEPGTSNGPPAGHPPAARRGGPNRRSRAVDDVVVPRSGHWES
jgi:hypothetical protein